MSLVSPVLVGRHAELSALIGAVEAARRGRGSAVFVTGEPGIGKSRLVAETAAAAARTGVRMLRGRAAAGGSAVPFRPLTEAIFSALRVEGAPASADLGPYWPALSRLGQLLPLGSAGVAEESLVVRAEAVLRLMAMLGEGLGCLLVLEDLHDADADTLAVVEYLVDNLAEQPILLLATVRSEPSAARELAEAAVARRSARRVQLGRLGDAAVSELAAYCLGTVADAVPAAVLQLLHRTADGTPFIVEELLSAAVGSGSLTAHGDRWRWAGPISTAVPATVAAAVRQRVERLGPSCVALLEAAAVLGRRFPVSVAAGIAGLDQAAAFRVLRAAVDAELVVADEDGDPGWHAFRHALILEAVAGRLLPGERVALSRVAARAVQAASAQLGDDWYQLAAGLWSAGADPRRAAALFTRAGRRATAQGALITAAELLERGLGLLEGTAGSPAAATAELLEALVHVLVLRGDADRVFVLGPRLDEALAAAGAEVSRQIAARMARARVAASTGRWDEGFAEVAAARLLAGEDAALTAPIDAVDAHLVFLSPRPDRLRAAEALATRAVAAAEAIPLPEVACEALEIKARCVRHQDLTAGQRVFERALAIAEAHDLVLWRVRALLELGVIEKLRHSEVGPLLRAREVAESAGAVISVVWIDLHLATVYINVGRYGEAQAAAVRAGERARQLRMRELELLATGARAGVAASQGRRDEMEAALAELGDSVLGYGVEVWGWARGACALLEEEREEALHHLRASARADEALPNVRASGYSGLYLLVRTVIGEASWAEHDAYADSPLAQVILHQPFVAWSRAVLLGREGRANEAAKAAAEALGDPARGPIARYLGGRLVAEVALADGWGEPVEWLRASEEYFHAQGVTRVAAACRKLLRQAGAQVTQRRRGHDAIPRELRQLGVTVREYDVLRLVADRLGDREIAERLFLSPRTVEKHVASLRARTGQADRAALVSYARRHVRRA